MDKKHSEAVNNIFQTAYMDAIKEFVRIPSLNPIFDPDWNPMVDIQATERALRIG